MCDAYSLLVPFVDESESFVLGFEAGRLWQMLADGVDVVGYLSHTKNCDQFRLIARALGLELDVESVNGEWMEVSFVPKQYHLKIVRSEREGQK